MKRAAGLWILLAVVLVVIGIQVMRPKGVAPGGTPTATSRPLADVLTVKGRAGGEKIGFLGDEAVTKIMRDKYGVALDFTKEGSIEMVEGPAEGQDFLWPSSQIAEELYALKHGRPAKSEVIFNSPIVLYSWDKVTDALIRVGVVQKLGEAYYIVDFPKLVRMVIAGKQWKDVGLPELYGPISIQSTDPTRSNSGNMFAGLLANVLNDGQVVNDATLPKVLPTVKQFFERLGYMENSSGDIFTQFLNRGMGDKPIIVGYESQLIEFSIKNERYLDLLRKKIRVLYPRPTVWSSHPFLALNANGSKALQALQDPEIQRIAWERHGFRTGLLGIQNDPKALKVVGVPQEVQSIIPMPRAQVMEKIIRALGP